MYNSDLAYQRYQHVLNQARRTQIPVPYDLDSPVTQSLNDTRDPWNTPPRPQVVRGLDLDGKEVDCHPDSLAAFKKHCHIYREKEQSIGTDKPTDLPTKYAEGKEAINRLIRNVHHDHLNLQAINEDILDDLVQRSATMLVNDSLDVIKNNVNLTPQAELHILQVLNDVVELTAHTVCEYNDVMLDTGMYKLYPELVIDGFVSAGEEIDRHIRNLWEDINT